MKKIFTFTLTGKFVFLAILFSSSLPAFCQPDYDFRNPTLISGTALQVNAVYLFQDVKPGVDATVTIKNITGTIYLSDIDGPSGYTEALQPILQVPPNASGYAEFEVNFFIANTSTPMIQVEIPATPIDVDGQNYGDGIVKEFDELELINGYVNYDMLGGELNMNITGNWVTGNNVAGLDYPGVDTTPRQVMFTTVNAGISKFTFRSGAISTSATQRQRLRSVYFKKFAYANAFLSKPLLISFSGNSKDQKIVLGWKVSATRQLASFEIEKSFDRRLFSQLTSMSNSASALYSFTDSEIPPSTIYYRLKMIMADNTVQYSNVLTFYATGSGTKIFKLYPAVITGNATVNIQSGRNEQTALQIFDINGRTVYHQQVALTPGNNSFTINGLGSLVKGNYVAAVNTGNTLQTQKIVIR